MDEMEPEQRAQAASLGTLKSGDAVWLMDTNPEDPNDVPIGAIVRLAEHGRVQVLDDNGEEHWFDVARANIKRMHPDCVNGEDDMVRLGELDGPPILRNLHKRYLKNQVYTYTGSILVSVNPYQSLPIYDTDSIKAYTNRKFGELPPHIYAVADNAYYNMQRNERDQVIIISGESGSGKTEAGRLVMRFLSVASGSSNLIEKQVMEASNVLEMFGNARTFHNDNASRFGKYIEVFFNRRGAIEGAKVEYYLLEKSRLVWQPEDERNFHIFYAMLIGMSSEDKSKLGLTKSSDYYYLTQDNLNKALSNKCFSKGLGSCLQCNGRNDRVDYNNILKSMKTLMFSEVEIKEIMKLLSAILHIGNFEFEEALIDNLDACHLIYNTGVKQVCQVLDVIDNSIIQALTYRTLKSRGETVKTPMNIDQAMDVKDALVKGIYGRLFQWIVGKINSAIYTGSREHRDCRSIGILDMFGFENFQKNCFEQLCINFANENLQQYFVRSLFKLEQEEYEREHVEWGHIDFQDNQPILDLIAAKPNNILSLVDDESSFPRGTDRTMLNKLSRTHARNDLFLSSRSQMDDSFGIKHYAGVVRYSSKGFVERNKDTFHGDLMALVQSSKNKFLKLLFYRDLKAGMDARKKNGTLIEQFKKSLDQLMRTMSKCQPLFIRCLKSNNEAKPMTFDRSLIMSQLVYSGMLETIQIRKKGYPIRYSFPEFIERYRVCLPGMKLPTDQDVVRAAKRLARHVLGSDGFWQLGATKLFLKDDHDTKLEIAREQAISKFVIVIQRAVRGWYAKRTFQRLKNSIVTIQSMWRGYLARRDYKVMVSGYQRLQALWRSRRLAFRYQFARKRIVGFQAHCRGCIVRVRYRQYKWAVVTVQAFVRGMIARRELKRLKKMRTIEDMPAKKKKETLMEMQRQEEASDKKLQKKRDILDTVKEQEKMRWSMGADPTLMMERLFGNMPRSGSGMPSALHAPSSASVGLGLQGLPAQGPGDEDVDDGDEQNAEIDEDEDISSFKFIKFAAMTFQAGHSSSYIRKPLKESLLTHENEEDNLSSMAVWISILRFMGDLPEPKYLEEKKTNNQADDTKSIKSRSKINVAKKFLKPGKDDANSISRSQSFMSESNISIDSQDLASAEVCGNTVQGLLPQQVPITNRIFETLGESVLRRVTTSEIEDKDDDLDTPLDEDVVPIEHRVVSHTLRRKSKLMDDMKDLLDSATKQAAKLASTMQYSRQPLPSVSGAASSIGESLERKSRFLSRSSASSASSTIGASSITGLSSHHVSNPVANPSSQPDWSSSQLEKWFKLNRPTSNIEKIQFIVGMAILRPKIRDEIYAQICKQLTNNPSKSSHARGWILLCLCCGCFAPSDRFIRTLRNFINEGPQSYAPFAGQRLKRTTLNGNRKQPPSATELEICKSKKPIRFTVTFMDGTTKTVLADSATTAKEIVTTLCDKFGIEDRFGFSL